MPWTEKRSKPRPAPPQRPWWDDADHMKRLEEESNRALLRMQREHLERCWAVSRES